MYRYQGPLLGFPLSRGIIQGGGSLYWKWVTVMTTPYRLEDDSSFGANQAEVWKAGTRKNRHTSSSKSKGRMVDSLPSTLVDDGEEKKDDERDDNCGEDDDDGDDISCVSSDASDTECRDAETAALEEEEVKHQQNRRNKRSSSKTRLFSLQTLKQQVSELTQNLAVERLLVQKQQAEIGELKAALEQEGVHVQKQQDEIGELKTAVVQKGVLVQTQQAEIGALRAALEQKDAQLKQLQSALLTEIAMKESLYQTLAEERERFKKEHRNRFESQSELEKELLNEIVIVTGRWQDAEQKHRDEILNKDRIHRNQMAEKDVEVAKLSEEIRRLKESPQESEKDSERFDAWKRKYKHELDEKVKKDERKRREDLDAWKRKYGKEMAEKVLLIASLKEELHRMKEKYGPLPSGSLVFNSFSSVMKKSGF